MIDLKDFALVAAAGGVVAAWSQIRGFLFLLSSLIVVPIKIEQRNLPDIAAYFFTKLRRISIGSGRYELVNAFRRSTWREERIGIEELQGTWSLFLCGWAPLLMVPMKHKGNRANDPDGVQIYYIRGTVNFDKLIVAIAQFSTALLLERRNRFNVQMPRGDAGSGNTNRVGSSSPDSAAPPSDPNSNEDWLADPVLRASARLLDCSFDDLGRRTLSGDALAALAMSAGMVEVADDIGFWLGKRQWYAKRNIPWRLGILLYGPPGTGKTVFARSCAEHYDLPVYLLDLSSETNYSLYRNWRSAHSNAPCMVVLEDFDNTFNKRARVNRNVEAGGINLSHGNELDFGGLLNVIDGIDKTDGILLVITTNKPETLDEALAGIDEHGEATVTRPGRIDRCLKFVPLTEAGRRQLAKTILDETPELIEPTVAAGENESGAKFTRRCVNIAREELWKRERNAQAR